MSINRKIKINDPIKYRNLSFECISSYHNFRRTNKKYHILSIHRYRYNIYLFIYMLIS